MPKPVTPLLSVDIIIEIAGPEPGRILLIRRRNPPFGWALPGGFVDVGESMERAAVREAREETSLDVRLHTLLGCYSDPQRDPRGHTASAVYIARAAGTPKAADDAAEVQAYAPDALPDDLAFDHGRIMADYRAWLSTGQLPAPTT